MSLFLSLSLCVPVYLLYSRVPLCIVSLPSTWHLCQAVRRVNAEDFSHRQKLLNLSDEDTPCRETRGKQTMKQHGVHSRDTENQGPTENKVWQWHPTAVLGISLTVNEGFPIGSEMKLSGIYRPCSQSAAVGQMIARTSRFCFAEHTPSSFNLSYNLRQHRLGGISVAFLSALSSADARVNNLLVWIRSPCRARDSGVHLNSPLVEHFR